MGRTTWSVSRAQVAQACTLRYHLKYRQRSKGKRKQNDAGRIGAAVHKLLEERLRGVDEQEAVLSAIRDARLTTAETHKALESREGVATFLHRFNAWCAKNGVTSQDLWYERPLYLADHVPVATYNEATWAGVCDVLARIPGEQATYVVIDHKTGRKRDSIEYMFQLQSYAHAVFCTFPDAYKVRLVLHWVNEDNPREKLDWCGKFFRDEHADMLRTWYDEKYAEADERAEEADRDPRPSQGEHCNFCEYRDVCPLMLINRPR